MFPRFLITLDSDLKEFPVTVRVGQVCPYLPGVFSYIDRFLTQGG